MKRFICYLYEYREGKRIRNIGFCKVERMEEKSTVSIHGKGWGMDGPKKLDLYLFWRENGMCCGVYQGELGNISPALNCRLSYGEEDLGSEERYDRVEGIILCGENGPRYAAMWTDEDVDISRMRIVEKEISETDEEAPCAEEEESMPEEPADTEIREESAAGEVKGEEPEVTEQGCTVPCRFQCTKIQRQDLSRLIRREWQLANNSFLLHGYYNYHHLAFLREGETLYLGVPGVYCEQEQRAAKAFGFPGFINYRDTMLELEEMDRESGPDFGYWCRQVHQIRV